MVGRIMAMAFMLGTGLVQLMAQLWSEVALWLALIGLLGLLVVSVLLRAVVWLRCGCLIFAAAIAGWVNASWQAQSVLMQQLPVAEENKPFKLVVQIESLVRLQPESRSFVARVLEAKPDHVPEIISLRWSSQEWGGPYAQPKAHDFPPLQPGQVWKVTSFLKTPHGARNLNGFDYEGYVFAQGVRATGAIRGDPELLSPTPRIRSIGLAAAQWRHRLREAMLPHLSDLRWGGVILALSIGDQASISPSDWQVFNRTGLTHLVSISGSHVTLLAAMSALFFAWIWRRLRWRGQAFTEYIPAAVAAGCLALLIAGLYSLTAGWEVPARRTFIMFGVTVVTLLWRLPMTITQIMAAAVVIVLLFDPWAILASGFWLSFGAVYVLVLCAHWTGHAIWQGGQSKWRTHWLQWRLAAIWQLVITVALLPPLAFLFFEISLVSPLSNAYAIPLIGLLITPLALFFALLSLSPVDWLTQGVLWLCHGLLELNMVMTVWLSEHPLASLPAARAPAWVLAVGFVGMLIALMPRALPFAWLGWGLILPTLFWRDPVLDSGEWRLHALDVGQGSAVVIETAQQVLVFDTGVRRGPQSDEGERTVMPYLRSLGKTQIDVLVLSHADLDHVGGTRSLLHFFPVQQSFSSFDLTKHIARESRLLMLGQQSVPLPLSQSTCARGQSWQVDGVIFSFVWPSTTLYAADKGKKIDKNAQSCVLQITGTHHQALLTGDVGLAQEKQLVELGLGAHDVVVVGHHGSKTSSGLGWVTQMQAQIAIAQVGWWSRFGHPHAEVQQRWEQGGAQFLRTDFHGGIVVHSSSQGLKTKVARLDQGRYWQNQVGLLHDKGNH